MIVYGANASGRLGFNKVGNGWGYANHTALTLHSLEEAGATITDDRDEADVVLWTCPGHLCQRIEGKVNVAHTCWESPTIPPNFAEPLSRMDAVSVTGSFLVEPLHEACEDLGRAPVIRYIPDGVASNRFAYVDRMGKKYKHKPRKGRTPMRFLWVGAPNARKGGEQLLEAWKAFTEHPDSRFIEKYRGRVELYIKTTAPEDESNGLVKHGTVTYDDRRLSLGDLIRLYQRSHCFVFPSVGEGFGFCVHPETEIETPEGPLHIERLNVGDRVMTSNGEYHAVRAVTRRQVKEIYEVETRLGCRVLVTGEHPFLTSKRCREAKNHPLSWRNATDLEVGDFIAVAKAKLDARLPARIDLAEVSGVLADDDSVWFKMGFSGSRAGESLAELSGRFGETKKVIEGGIRKMRRGIVGEDCTRSGVIAAALTDEGYSPATPKRYQRFVAVDDRFLDLLGWYIAEGSPGNNGSAFELSCGEGDAGHVEPLMRYLEGLGAQTQVYRPDGTKCVRYVVCHGPLSRWLAAACGRGSHYKQIPQDFYAAGVSLQPLIKALFAGDGHAEPNGCGLTTVSKKLAYQVRQILTSWSIAIAIRRDKRNDGFRVSVGGSMADRLCDKTGIEKNRSRKLATSRTGSAAIDVGSHLLLPIKSIRKLPYTGDVCDISVDGEHSFVGGGLVLHNTMAEAMATGLPVIYTPATAMVDLAPCCPVYPPEVYNDRDKKAYGVEWESQYGYPLGFEWQTFDWSWKETGQEDIEIVADVAAPDVNDLLRKICWVADHWVDAVERGRRGSERIRKEFRWSTTGTKLFELIQDVMPIQDLGKITARSQA